MLPKIKNPESDYNKNIISLASANTEPTIKRFQLRKA